MTDETPVYGCTIDGRPAMAILVDEYNQLVTGLAQVRAELVRSENARDHLRDRAEAELRRYTEADSADAAAGSYARRAETAEAALLEARRHLAAAYAQRDRLRIRMNRLADRWDRALAVDKPYARTLRSEISVEPFEAQETAAPPAPGSDLWAGVAVLQATANRVRQAAAPVDPEAERAASERARQLAAEAEHASEQLAALDTPHIGIVVEPYRNDQNQARWVARCWGTDTCDGWLSLDHTSEQWAQQARDRHVAEEHAEPAPAATEAADRATRLDVLVRDILSTFVATRDSTGMHVTHHQARVLPHEMQAWQDALDATEEN